MADVAAPQRAPARRLDVQRAPRAETAAPASPRLDVCRLQRALGNRGMVRFLRGGTVQGKLTVGRADHPFEQEADRVAEAIMRMPEPSASTPPARAPMPIRRLCPECEPEASDAFDAPSPVESYLTASRGGGQPLADPVRAYFEPRFGHPFGHVRVHADDAADRASSDIGARAFTTGSDIYFARGQYTPGTTHGDWLLAHELTHVLQQGGGGSAPPASSDGPAARRTMASTTEFIVQRVADKSDVPAMTCTPDLTPGTRVGTNIMFGQDDRTLDSGDKARIATEHAAWLARGGIDTLTVDGFASSDGAAKDNWTLSCDRAEAVKAELVGLGVPPGMVTTIAHGETEEFSATSLSPNRRAVIRSIAGTAPTVVIFPVTFGLSLNRVPPGRTVPVIIITVGVPAGRTIDLDIQGSGGTNGTAAVAPATIAGSAIVDVTGGVQTTPGSAGNLRVRARMGGLTVGTSAGFTVAAHPTDFSVTLNADLNTPAQVGLLANNAWTSDGTGGVAELDQVQRGEAIEQGPQDRPPFFSGLGAPSGKSPGNVSPVTDTHAEPRASIRTNAFLLLLGRRFTDVVKQLFIFDDARTGLVNQVAVNSGFTITSTVSFNAATAGWEEQTVKTGAAVTVGGNSATAGSGTATSLVHPL